MDAPLEICDHGTGILLCVAFRCSVAGIGALLRQATLESAFFKDGTSESSFARPAIKIRGRPVVSRHKTDFGAVGLVLAILAWPAPRRAHAFHVSKICRGPPRKWRHRTCRLGGCRCFEFWKEIQAINPLCAVACIALVFSSTPFAPSLLLACAR